MKFGYEKEKMDLEFERSFKGVKEMLQGVKSIPSNKKHKEEVKKKQRKDTDIIKSDAEKIKIGLEVLADIKRICKADYPEVEGYTVIFEGEQDRNSKKKKGNDEGDKLFLGGELSCKELYESYADQIFTIFYNKIVQSAEQKQDDFMDKTNGYIKTMYRTYMNLIYRGS